MPRVADVLLSMGFSYDEIQAVPRHFRDYPRLNNGYPLGNKSIDSKVTHWNTFVNYMNLTKAWTSFPTKHSLDIFDLEQFFIDIGDVSESQQSIINFTVDVDQLLSRLELYRERTRLGELANEVRNSAIRRVERNSPARAKISLNSDIEILRPYYRAFFQTWIQLAVRGTHLKYVSTIQVAKDFTTFYTGVFKYSPESIKKVSCQCHDKKLIKKIICPTCNMKVLPPYTKTVKGFLEQVNGSLQSIRRTACMILRVYLEKNYKHEPLKGISNDAALHALSVIFGWTPKATYKLFFKIDTHNYKHFIANEQCIPICSPLVLRFITLAKKNQQQLDKKAERLRNNILKPSNGDTGFKFFKNTKIVRKQFSF